MLYTYVNKIINQLITAVHLNAPGKFAIFKTLYKNKGYSCLYFKNK